MTKKTKTEPPPFEPTTFGSAPLKQDEILVCAANVHLAKQALDAAEKASEAARAAHQVSFDGVDHAAREYARCRRELDDADAALLEAARA